MRSHLLPVDGLAVALALTALGGSGCSRNGEPDRADAAVAHKDAGTSHRDAGMAHRDAGVPHPDAGVAQATVAFEEPLPTFVAPLDPVVVRVRVTPPGLANAVRWQVQPLAPTADVTLDRSEGRELVFHGVSRNASGGSRSANPALGYRVTANLDGQGAVQASSLVTQDEVDVLRQEYVDYGTAFRPDRKHLGALKHPALNTGNYDVVAEEEVGTLDALLERVNAEVNRMLAERRMSATFQFEDCVTSGFRNPQRNRAVGSVAMNSRHVRGRA